MLNRHIILTLTVLCAAIAFLTLALHSASKTDDHREIKVGATAFRVRIADSTAEQMQGLSGVERLDDDEGMLFVFPDTAPRQFWMKDMRFPLDVLWIADGVVADISHSVPAPTAADIPRMGTELEVNQVLEIRGGTARRLGISVGDRVE